MFLNDFEKKNLSFPQIFRFIFRFCVLATTYKIEHISLCFLTFARGFFQAGNTMFNLFK